MVATRWLVAAWLAYVGLVALLAIVVGIKVRSFKPLLWPLHETFASLAVIVGVPVVILLSAAAATNARFSPLFGRTLLEWRPRWAWLWGNDEDGIDGLRDTDVANGEWRARTAAWPRWLRVIAWSAFRNPVGNLRFVRPFGFFIDPKRICSTGTTGNPDVLPTPGSGWAFTSCGAYSGLWLVRGSRQLRIGWKLKPMDAQGLDENDYRRKGCGFALQWGKR